SLSPMSGRATNVVISGVPDTDAQQLKANIEAQLLAGPMMSVDDYNQDMHSEAFLKPAELAQKQPLIEWSAYFLLDVFIKTLDPPEDQPLVLQYRKANSRAPMSCWYFVACGDDIIATCKDLSPDVFLLQHLQAQRWWTVDINDSRSRFPFPSMETTNLSGQP